MQTFFYNGVDYKFKSVDDLSSQILTRPSIVRKLLADSAIPISDEGDFIKVDRINLDRKLLKQKFGMTSTDLKKIDIFSPNAFVHNDTLWNKTLNLNQPGNMLIRVEYRVRW